MASVPTGWLSPLPCQRLPPAAARGRLQLANLFRMQKLPPPLRRSAQIETLRTQLFKIGARIRQTTRCIHIHLATGWLRQHLFQSTVHAINSS